MKEEFSIPQNLRVSKLRTYCQPGATSVDHQERASNSHTEPVRAPPTKAVKHTEADMESLEATELLRYVGL
jgi:hypothetical protein